MPSSRVRSAVPSDLAALTELYNHYVRETPTTFDLEPFSVETRRPWFEAFAARGRHRLLVVEEDGALRGFASSRQFRPKAAYGPSVETTVYLAAGESGRGLGTLLYTELFQALRGEHVHRALAGITLPNPASVRLHRRFGFETVGVFSEVGYKFGRYWDVEWYQKALP